jgi:outer membrane protein TolC
MKANVARAEYAMKRAQAKKTGLKYKDIQRKYKQGIATRLELSGGSLQYSQAELEAMDVQKTYQQAMLDIAVELNEWDKVEVYEKKINHR